MSAFDLDNFMTQTTAEANDTTFTPVPEGEYNAVISDIKPRTTSAGQSILDVTYQIDDQTARDVTGLDKPTVRQSIFLDINAAGNLDNGKGKNINLGKLREACGMNVPGKPFSPSMLFGQVVRVLVKHRLDKDDPNTRYADVKGVTRAA